MRYLVIFSVLALYVSDAVGQGGYYVSRTVIYPELTVVADAVGLPISSNREDVRAIGMGKAQVANGLQMNAMLYNPALLSSDQTRLEIPTVQASLPTKSFEAISFLADNVNEFKTGNFLKLIRGGLRDLKVARNEPEVLAALRKIQEGLKFPNELQQKVGGTFENPRTHGISITPGIQLQFGTLGASVYGIAQSGFQVLPGEAITVLSNIRIPESTAQLTIEDYLTLLAAVEPLLDANGEIKEGALPEAYAVSYLDLVGAVGYALPLSKELSIGANLKLINRRLSSKRVAPDYFDKILSEVRKDFNTSVTGVTLDLGGLYRFPSGTQVGLSILNAIPVQKLASNMSARFIATGIADYDRDPSGNIIVDANGDTALVGAEQKVLVRIPIELKEPLLLNVGVTHPITQQWDVSLDVVDLASQDDKFENYLQRLRIGTEYRLDAIKDHLGIALRAGFADKRPTLGLGINLFRIVQLDGAFAYDSFIGENSYFAQVRLGW